MQHLGLLFNITVLLINLWGMMLATGLLIRNRWLACAGGPWIWTTLFFAIETHHGLGKLHGVGVVFTLLSVGIILLSNGNWVSGRYARLDRHLELWRAEFKPGACYGTLITFTLLFFYSFAWRLAFPDIDGSSEKIPDLMYICTYLPGGTLPATDFWLAPNLSYHYYSFQYYAAALMGRLLGLTPGITYNLALCAITALAGISFAGVVNLLARKIWVRILLVTAFTVGGPGVSGFVYLFYKDPMPWNTNRFVGGLAYDKAPVGTMMQEYASQHTRQDLAGESFAYTAFLGDYHPPYSGYCLLGLGALAAVLYSRTKRNRYAALVGATLTWTLLSNTWTLPLQVIWISGWVLWERKRWLEVIGSLAVGAAAVWLAAAVYLTAFTSAAGSYATSLKLVPWELHSPLLLYLLFLLPTIALGSLGFYARNKLCLWGATLTLIYLALSEFTFIDDVYSGDTERFNTTLKWWPWIAAATLMMLGPVLIERATRKWVRICAIIFCAYPCAFGVQLAKYWWLTPKINFAKLEGDAYLRKDESTRHLLDQLTLEPPGIAIERPNPNSFTNSAVVPLFAGKQMWLGWVGHELLWHGYAQPINQRMEKVEALYKGYIDGIKVWPEVEKVDYILWYQTADTNELWARLDIFLKDHYTWRDAYTTPEGKKVGYWRRSVKN